VAISLAVRAISVVISDMNHLAGQRLVVFGCGDLGAEVARQGLARGVGVTALTRNPVKAAALRATGVEVVEADLASAGWHARIAGGADFVVNCVSSGGAGVDGYRRSYVVGMTSIVAWALSAGGVGTIVYTGSTSVYPQGGGASVDETAPVATAADGDRPALLIDAERVLFAGARAGAAARACVLRLAGLYGPGRTHLLEQVRAGEVAGRGDVRLNLVHRDDAAAAVWAALTAPAAVASGVFNVADDGAAAKAEVVAWLAEKLGVPPPRFTGAPAAGRRAVTPDRVIAAARIKAVLGWRPRFPDFRAGYENILSHAGK
jgi:nucleoside-diphosphate-sugar epimerase